MSFLTDGVGRFEKTLHKIMVVIMKKCLGQCLRGGLLFSDRTCFKCFVFLQSLFQLVVLNMVTVVKALLVKRSLTKKLVFKKLRIWKQIRF